MENSKNSEICAWMAAAAVVPSQEPILLTVAVVGLALSHSIAWACYRRALRGGSGS